MNITIPNPGRGRRNAEKEVRYQQEKQAFYGALLEIDSSIDITVSSRGWCYLLEEYGLTKGEFSRAEKLINDGRKDGSLPTDICSDDDARSLDGVETISPNRPEAHAEHLIHNVLEYYIARYTPHSQWEEQDSFIIMAVEKKDLLGIFSPVCEQYGVPLANFKGWSDINSRLSFMRLFQKWESKGKKCVLLYCGDHDPGGIQISDQLRKNMTDLSGTWRRVEDQEGKTKTERMDWRPDNLVIDRFGLNYDFIQQQRLSWVENLITGSGNNLATSKEGKKSYVQDYISKYGVRKVEANALVTRIDAGRELCKQAILKYLDGYAFYDHREEMQQARQEVRDVVSDRMKAA